jgi:hypothetical protein
MAESNRVLERVLNEIQGASDAETIRASHSSFVSGVFEQAPAGNQVLARVLNEIQGAASSETVRASHSSFVSGVFES